MLAGSIANAKLANSSLTVGNTAISLGSTVTNITGLASVTTTTLSTVNLNLTGAFNNQRIKINENIIEGLTSNENVEVSPAGTGTLLVRSNVLAEGAVFGLNPALPGISIFNSTSNKSSLISFQASNSASISSTFVTGSLTSSVNTVTGAPFTFLRSRGNPLVPTASVSGDEITTFDFLGFDGTNGVSANKIRSIVDNTVSTGIVPGKLEFLTTNLAGSQAVRFTVSSTAVTSTVPISNGSLQLFQNNLTGLNSNEDIVIAPAGTGGVKIDKVAAPTATTTASSIGYLGMPVSTVTGTGTLTLADAGKHIYIGATGQTVTIPANGTVAYPIGTTIAFIAGPSATTVTIAITTDTMYLAGTGTTGSRTLAAFGMATAVKIASTSWIINGTGLT